LKKKLYDVLGEEEIADTLQENTVAELNVTREPVINNAPTPTSALAETPAPPTNVDTEVAEGDEDTLSYFAKLAQS
jgi:hypothetical protein